MIYSSLDSSRQDESNDSKIIPIGAIFAEIAIFAKFQVGSGRGNCLTRPEFSGRVRSGTRISGQKCRAIMELKDHLKQKMDDDEYCANKLQRMYDSGESFDKFWNEKL